MRRLKAAGAVWLIGVLPTGFAGWMLFAVSDLSRERAPGAILLMLAVAALGVGLWSLGSPGSAARIGSLALSAIWLVGAAAVYPRMEFAADAWWAAGVPAAIGLVTALLAARPVSHRDHGSAELGMP